ncbi:MAG: thiamine-monophosphate kinase [Oceanospirillaceae bacterium]|jgi:thiamine-monophosphate kinase
MDEFSLIKHFFEQPNASSAQKNSALIQGIGDDCAILSVPDGMDLVFSLDTLVEDVHFPKDASPADIAWRLLGAAVSDLAAMGAVPNSFTLALTLPELSQTWLKSFSENLALAADTYGVSLAGGDTTKGPLCLSAQVQGFVKKGAALLRSSAKVDEFICVTGCLGDSRAGLSLLDTAQDNSCHNYLLERFYRPTPRIAAGLIIKDFASACIDVSDGLLADLNHILSRSAVGATIDATAIPMSAQMHQVAKEQALQWALTGGEDFELCFTLPQKHWPQLQQRLQAQDIAVSNIGIITTDKKLQMLQDGQLHGVTATGFNHFSK